MLYCEIAQDPTFASRIQKNSTQQIAIIIHSFVTVASLSHISLENIWQSLAKINYSNCLKKFGKKKVFWKTAVV